MEEYIKSVKILVVDDEFEARDIFSRFLKKKYPHVSAVGSAEKALEILDKEDYNIVLTDLSMPHIDGLELIATIKEKWKNLSIVVISGKASIEKAVEAMKLGADDFIEKPVESLDLISIIIDKILKNKWQLDEIKRLKDILNYNFESNLVIGNSLSMQNILSKIKKISPLETTVLLTGETGVGKNVFAELIHRNSNRKLNKFVTVHCGSIPENLLESILFGHKKGSFTHAVKDKIGYFQEADHGTIFLDEITETTQAFQIKLLRVLEQGVIRQVGADTDIDIDVRIIAATNKNLKDEVNKELFREDLYYRLNVIAVEIPPLRERREDIPVLASFFLKHFSEQHNKQQLRAISDPVMRILYAQEWEGNIRELKNVIEHAVALTSHDMIILDDLPSYLFNEGELDKTDYEIEPIDFSSAKKKFEKKYLINLLQKAKGNISTASEASGIARPNLYKKLEKYKINIEKYR